MNENILISVVIPVYRAENILNELANQLETELLKITNHYEIILVEDCGPDKSWLVIENICKERTHFRGIKLSRNFGQHYAIAAGLEKTLGQWIVIMDCDLQDRPDQIIKLYNKANEGYDIVQGSRENRKDGFLKRQSSWIFYKILSYLSGNKLNNNIANFGIYNRKVILAICSLPEKIRFFPTLIDWVGFKKGIVTIEHSNRHEGKSSYTLNKLINLSMDVILAYSDKPLRLIVKLGFATSLISVLYALYMIIQFYSGEIIVLGYTSLIISIWFLSGILIFILGIIGLYIGKIFENVKDRPLYIIDKEIN
jgi:Glycosyltransferases involved in cell wall biogenesis